MIDFNEPEDFYYEKETIIVAMATGIYKRTCTEIYVCLDMYVLYKMYIIASTYSAKTCRTVL